MVTMTPISLIGPYEVEFCLNPNYLSLFKILPQRNRSLGIIDTFLS